MSLAEAGTGVDYIGSDDVDGPELHNKPLVRFLNLRGDQSENAKFRKKVLRVASYYGRLIKYTLSASPPVFHILWHNRFELFDRTLLLLYYRALGKKVILTAHNVNAAKRDRKDSWLNRFTLRIQYKLAEHIFVHTRKMEQELVTDFNVRRTKISVIPFGLNETFPFTPLTLQRAKQKLQLGQNERTLLFFGRIAPYKGLEYLVNAFAESVRKYHDLRLVIAGKIEKGCSAYWENIRRLIRSTGTGERIIEKIGWIPDNEVEVYFKAADVVVIPYTDIFQSGVPFLAYSFGLPVIATDVGSLREDVIEGKTGFICEPKDPCALAKCIEKYFSSDLFKDLDMRRPQIREFAKEHHSWATVARITTDVYRSLECVKLSDVVWSQSKNLTQASN